MSISSNSQEQRKFVSLPQPLNYLDWCSRNWELIKIRKPDIYELKIKLAETEPTIYRTILIPADTTLKKLHLVIQKSFNWWNYHLFQFVGFGKNNTLEQVFQDTNKMVYEYDFGTTQTHLITKIKTHKFDENMEHKVFPVCIEAGRFAPFEDSSDWDYMLEIAKDKTHDEHEETIDWLKDMWRQTTMGYQGSFSVSKVVSKKVNFWLINSELAMLQLYPIKDYKEHQIPTSASEFKKQLAINS